MANVKKINKILYMYTSMNTLHKSRTETMTAQDHRPRKITGLDCTTFNFYMRDPGGVVVTMQWLHVHADAVLGLGHFGRDPKRHLGQVGLGSEGGGGGGGR